MVTKEKDCYVDYRTAMRGGPGTVQLTKLASSEDMNFRSRFFAKMVLEPGSGIGFHQHNGENEIFYIISGHGIYDDDGKAVEVEAGDVTVTTSGQGHAIHNDSDEDLVLIALIILV